jgi:CubicO group peptidase (beta-lactamase class C family)
VQVASILRALTIIFSALLLTFAANASDYAQWLSEAYPANGPGAAAIVVRDGEVLYRGASGMADMELSIPLSADNVFRIGSISKQFTAAAILLLEEQGKLSVSDDINSYLPDYPTHGHTITIEHLLTHSSGIFNYTSIPGYFNGAAIRKDVTTEELIAVFANMPMDFSPGDAFRYSNSGYVLLGAIIEEVSGQSYADFMQTEVFDRLDLQNTSHGGLQLVPGRVRGYAGTPGEYRNAGFLSMTQPHGAGTLLSTVDDLAKWTKALFGGELISEASLDKMTAEYKLNDGQYAGYGYGLFIGERFGKQEISHRGGIHGFSTSGIWIPEEEVYVAVLSNSESVSPDFVTTRMAFDAAGADYPRLSAVALDLEKIADYVGVYRIDDQNTCSVTSEDGRLYTQRTGGGCLEILAHSEDAFFYPNTFTHLMFERDTSGRVVSMSMYHRGTDTAELAERISEFAHDD